MIKNKKNNYEIMNNNKHEYVDLGLPSGIKWAKCNVGATKEYEYGKYFQWGDTVGYEGDDAKAHSIWRTAPFNGGSELYNETEFNAVKDTVCPDGVLALKYDAAHVNMGGNWRMPNRGNIDELVNCTNHEIVTIGEKRGMKYSNKTDSSKYIFVPFVGHYVSDSFGYEGCDGCLWSRTINGGVFAYILFCDINGHNMTESGSRAYGFTVRGVLEK